MLHVEGDRKALTATVTVQKLKNGEDGKTYHMQGRRIGPSLAFSAIAAEQARATKVASDPYHPRNIGAALSRLGACKAKPATTWTLASEITSREENEPQEQWELRVKSRQKELTKRAKLGPGDRKTLAAYAEQATTGRKELMWGLLNSEGED